MRLLEISKTRLFRSFLILVLAPVSASGQTCGIKPVELRPVPPPDCKDMAQVCACGADGQSCHWTWACVPQDKAQPRVSLPNSIQPPIWKPLADRPAKEQTPEMPIPKSVNQSAIQKPFADLATIRPVTIAASSKPQVDTLRVIAQRIEKCSKALDFERRWGKKKDEIEQYYQEAPANLVWDVVAGNSVRAPYLAYVEFTVAEDHWVPESAGVRFWSSTASIAYTGIISASPWHYRYEYDLGPDGIKLTRVLLKNKTTGEWVEPNKSVVANHCWDAAARDTHTEANAQAAEDQQESAHAASLRGAAEQGNAVAAYSLGALYEDGHGLPQNYALAALWYRKAAEQGHVIAQYALGVLFSQGRPGLPQDYAQSAAWYRRAAEQNYANAQFYLGIAYALGHGVPEDYAEAYFWIELGSAGKLEGIKQVDVYAARRDAASFLTQSDISREQKRVMKWLENHPRKSD